MEYISNKKCEYTITQNDQVESAMIQIKPMIEEATRSRCFAGTAKARGKVARESWKVGGVTVIWEKRRLMDCTFGDNIWLDPVVRLDTSIGGSINTLV